jgi:hypothetical protein
MADPKRMSDEDLIIILRKEESDARQYQSGVLSPVRTSANNYYDRLPYGDEQEGSSKVVTSEFADAVEDMMPSLMEVFAGTDKVVKFIPSGRGQEQHAEEATDWVGHCFMQKNNGFLLMHSALKDGLMSRMGGISVDIAEREETIEGKVQGLTEQQINAMIVQAEAEGVEMEAVMTPDQPMMGEGMEMGLPAPIVTYSGTVKATRSVKDVVCDAIAPEDILFTSTARDQDKCSMMGYVQRTTASDLIKLGLKAEEIADLASERPNEPEDNQRTDGAAALQQPRDTEGDSERAFWLVLAFVKADFEGNGISTTERVLYAHAGGVAARIIEREEWDGPSPIAIATPILMPHTIVGRSLFDQNKDLQQINSVLTRGMLDNLYMSVRPRIAVSDQVILDSVLDWVPGAPIRFKAGAKPGDGHIDWQKVPSIMPDALSALEYFNTVQEKRSGTNRASNQGLDADSLNKTKGGMQMMFAAASQRKKLIARTFAETFLARVYKLIYHATKRAAAGPMSYWSGGSFRTVDPTKWPDVMDMEVNVGQAAGNTQQDLEHLQLLELTMEKLVALQGGQATGPWVTPDNVANLAQTKAEKLGYKTPGIFFQPPEKVEQITAQPQPEKPDPEMVKVQGMLAAQQAKQEGEIALANAKAQAEMESKRAIAAAELQLQRERAAAELEIIRERAAAELQIQRERAALDAQLKLRELEQEAALGALEIEKNAEVQGAAQQREQEVGA